MNNKTQPTPEKLAKWTEEFEIWFQTQLTVASFPRVTQQAFALHGFLRAKQENEQIMKLAKFGAKVIKLGQLTTIITPEHTADLLRKTNCYAQVARGDMLHYEFEPNIKATIKDLLND